MGAIVHRVSYHGDVGTHVGKSMWAILREIDGDVNKLNEIPADKRNEFMSRMYVEGARAAKESPEAKAEIDELAKQSFVLDDPLYNKFTKSVKVGVLTKLTLMLGDLETCRLSDVTLRAKLKNWENL